MTTIIVSGSPTSATVVAALSRAARQCSVAVPSAWTTATTRDHVEIRDDFLLETVDDILDRHDLPGPIAQQQTIAGDGSETYTLNADFRRLQRDQMAVYDNQLDRPCIPITNDGDYTQLKDLGTAGVVKYYRLRGYEGNYEIDFYQEPTSEITVSYITSYWMANSAGVVGADFASEDDVLILPRRAIETGIVWRFRERRGLPYEDKALEYEAILSRLSNDSRGRRMINMGEPSKDVKWTDLVPAFIPPS